MRDNLWLELTDKLDLKRLRSVPVYEKFQFVEYIKLLRNEAIKMHEHGRSSLRESEFYQANKTYRMLAALVAEGVSFEDMRHIARNYLANFTHSDVYYAKFAILAIGTILMSEGVDADSIFHILLSLLGEEFLSENLKLIGYEQARTTPPVVEATIHYKEYEERYRKTKYQILALSRLATRNGLPEVDFFMDHIAENPQLKLYYRILRYSDPLMRKEIVRLLYRTSNDYSQMVVIGINSLLDEKSTMVAHYMMNSIIGKYDHYDQRPEKVNREVESLYLELRKKIEELKPTV